MRTQDPVGAVAAVPIDPPVRPRTVNLEHLAADALRIGGE